jgi:hypothetical protein
LKRADREINSPLPSPRQLTPQEAENPETPFVLATQSFFGLTDDQIWTAEGRDRDDAFWNLSPNSMIQLVKCMTMRDFLDFQNQRETHLQSTKAAPSNQFIKPKIDLEHKDITIIKDIRFENEAEYIRNLGGEIWHIARNNTEQVKKHSSEAGIKVQAGDILIENNGTLEEYKNAVHCAFSNLKEKLTAQ